MSGFYIGKIKIAGNATLAPLAGYGDMPFRRLCRDCGAALTVTEMISVKGLLYDNRHTAEMLTTADNERPSCVQLFGSEPELFAEIVALPMLAPFDIIDINMGCPAPKVVKCGDGSALLSDPKKIAKIVSSAVKATPKPITVKLRLGIDRDDSEVLVRTVEDAGASAITLHGRTARQGYSGTADWDAVCRAAESVDIPLIGNGDVTAENAAIRLKGGPIAAVAIGRGAVGNPAIFSLIAGREPPPLKELIRRHFDYMLARFEPCYVAVNMRKHLAAYLKGKPGLKELKVAINYMSDPAEMLDAVLKALP